MIKKILLAVISFILIFSFINILLKFNEKKKSPTILLSAVPSTAGIILESNSPSNLWSKIKENNPIWEDLIQNDFFRTIDSSITIIDSISKKNTEINTLINDKKIILSLHQTSTKTIDAIFFIPISKEITIEKINQILIGAENKTKTQSHLFEGETITTATLSPNKNIHYALLPGVLSLSFSPILIEEVIRHNIKKISLLNNEDFLKIKETTGNKVDGNIFINYKLFASQLSTVLNSESKKIVSGIEHHASWGSLDLNIKPSSIRMNGFSYCNDTSNSFISLFSDQKPQLIEVTKIIPNSTVSFIFYGLSNFQNFNSNYHNKFNPDSNYLNEENRFISSYNIDLKKNLTSWIGNEIAFVITENEAQKPQENKYGILKTANKENALTLLQELAASTSKGEIKENEYVTYKDFKIQKLLIDSSLKYYYGILFSEIINPYYTLVDNYFVFANTTNALKLFIDSYISDKTLEKDINYNSFAENISSEANIYLYTNVSKTTSLLKNYLNESTNITSDNNINLFNKFEGLALQISASNNLFYNNLFLQHRPKNQEKKADNLLVWRQQLDTTISQKPHIVVNHNDKSKEIFVQDNANTIYLLNNEGEILWKQKIDEKIESEIFQVDAFKNKKLQLLFSTKNKIYLIDRNGKNIEKFPIKLPASASSGIAIFDYDNNKDYRILISCDDLKTYNYNVTGNQIDGWTTDSNKELMTRPFQYFNLLGKDYLVNVGNKGSVFILDRKGETRIRLKEKIFISNNNNFYLEKGKDLSSTKIITTDSTGLIQKLSFTDNIEKIRINNFSSNHYFNYVDINNNKNKEYIITDENLLEAFDINKSKLFSYQSADTIIFCEFFKSPSNDPIFVITNPSNDTYTLIDNSGNLLKHTSLKGKTLFALQDIYNTSFINLVVGYDNVINVYSLK